MSARHKQKFSGGRDSPDEPSRPPRKEDKSRTVGSRTGLNTYWISGEGIVREVLQRQICRMLGNEARSQPGEYNGVLGYRIQAVRPFTQDQLDDLISISNEYKREKEEFVRSQRSNRSPHTDLPYNESQTSRNHDIFPEDQYTQSYSTPGSLDTYPLPHSQYSHPSASGYQGRGDYSPQPPMSSSTGYPSMYAPSRPLPDQSMDYGRVERPRVPEQYMQSGSYGAPPQTGYGHDPSIPRYIGPIENVGSLHRTQQPYSQPQMSSPDVIMQEGPYSYPDLDPSRTSHRGVPSYPPQPSHVARTFYDDRAPPNQGPYKSTAPREEKRRRDDYGSRR